MKFTEVFVSVCHEIKCVLCHDDDIITSHDTHRDAGVGEDPQSCTWV